jgi:hypothetical protein
VRFGSLTLGLCSALALALFSSLPAASQFSNSVMPGPGWQVMRAQWGSGNRQMDVTPRVRALLLGNGMVQVNNQNMGGDPAVGAAKTLVIQARNFQGQTRRFTFREGSAIDASQFYNYGGGLGGNAGPGWQVMFADWGAGNRRVVVTDRVRSMLSGSGMVRVNNQNLGSDPAVGAAKTLRISARPTRADKFGSFPTGRARASTPGSLPTTGAFPAAAFQVRLPALATCRSFAPSMA